jgi:hypothetical protein
VGNPAVTNVTNAASPRSFAAANASSIRPLCPLAIDDDMFANCMFLIEKDGVELEAARDAAAGNVRDDRRCSMDEEAVLVTRATSGRKRRCMK